MHSSLSAMSVAQCVTENDTLACVFVEGGVNCILPMYISYLDLRFGLPAVGFKVRVAGFWVQGFFGFGLGLPVFGFKVRLWYLDFGFTVLGFGFKVLFFCLDSVSL